MVAKKVVERSLHRILEPNLWHPLQQLRGVLDAGAPVSDVFVAVSVVGGTLDLFDAGCRWEMRPERVTLEFANEQLRQLLDACLVVGIAHIEDPAVAPALVVG